MTGRWETAPRAVRAAAVATVLVSDAVANGWANHAVDPTDGLTAGRAGHGLVTLVAVGLARGHAGSVARHGPPQSPVDPSLKERHASSSAASSATGDGSLPATTSARVTSSSTRR